MNLFFGKKKLKSLLLIKISTASFNVMTFFYPKQGCVEYMYSIY